jgi:DNA-binding LytR/AlgR family response regulator
LTDENDLDQKLDEALSLLRALRPPRRRIGVVDGEGQSLLRPEDIVYFTTAEGQDRKLVVTLADGSHRYNFKGMAQMATILKDDVRFQRVHKSFLVNLEHVTFIRTVEGGRELGFGPPLQDLKIKVAQDNVKALEAYFGLD